MGSREPGWTAGLYGLLRRIAGPALLPGCGTAVTAYASQLDEKNVVRWRVAEYDRRLAFFRARRT